eukprot:TRINITY_DN8560_c0_g1_i1.p1 TRINITY_DN8560_c0_g1~~TRINITY_DN8560_c0_g1_i1.p1  ORF type:complete len:623 (+),score=191.54 TRINITY_DN8560_c0_g1_i1:83-1951(+)
MESNTTLPTSNQNDVPKATTTPSKEFKIQISNLSKMVSELELRQAFESNIPFPVKKAHINYYGPKSTGKGWVSFDTAEAALEAKKKMHKFKLFDQEMDLVFGEEHKEKRKIQNQRNKSKKSADLPYAAELEQVKSKFGDAMQMLKSDPPIQFTIDLVPSDPEFPFDLDQLQLRLEIPEDYPKSPCQFNVLNADLPEKLARKVESALQDRAIKAYKNKNMILGLLRWLDNQLENLLVDRVLTTKYQMAQQGIQMFTPQQIKNQLFQDENKDGKVAEISEDSTPAWVQHQREISGKSEQIQDEESDSQDEDSEEGSEEDSEKLPEKKSEFSTTTAHRGTQLRVENLKLNGIGILNVSHVNLVTVCERCKKQTQLMLQDQIPHGFECDTCHQVSSVTFRGNPLHEMSDVMGYLDLQEVQPFDLIQVHVTASCLECSQNFNLKGVSPTGTTYSDTCHNCHTKMSVSMDRIKFVKIRAQRSAQIPAANLPPRKKKVRDPKLAGIKVGTPLPDNGTCRHYKRSQRWMRFPCCGRVYACDICHYEGSPDHHEAQRAQRMICGLCSKEGPWEDACKNCGHEFVRTSLHFWEGGKGQRDASKLNRNDPHKYRGGNKTKSMKDTRVGPKKRT